MSSYQLDHTKDTTEAFILSRDAVGLANEAFFDPSMMGLLYFVRIVSFRSTHTHPSPTNTNSRYTRLCSRRLLFPLSLVCSKSSLRGVGAGERGERRGRVRAAQVVSQISLFLQRKWRVKKAPWTIHLLSPCRIQRHQGTRQITRK